MNFKNWEVTSFSVLTLLPQRFPPILSIVCSLVYIPLCNTNHGVVVLS